jgi:hypothetical protein
VRQACREARVLGSQLPGVAAAEVALRHPALAIPLLVRQRCIGCLYLDHTRDRLRLDPADVLFLEALAGQLAQGLERMARDEHSRREREQLEAVLREQRREPAQARLAQGAPPDGAGQHLGPASLPGRSASPVPMSFPSAPSADRLSDAGELDASLLWDSLRTKLLELIEATLHAGPGRLVPLGKWLSEDLIVEAHVAAGGVIRRGATLLGIPQTTFRRRFRQATSRAGAGLTWLPGTWTSVRRLLAGMVRASRSDHQDLLEQTRVLLLELVSRRVPQDVPAAAALMGVTEPTYYRWLAQRKP